MKTKSVQRIMIKTRTGLSPLFILPFFLFSATVVSAAQSAEKELVGMITGVLPGEKSVQIYVVDKDKASNTIVVLPETEIKKQIDLKDIQAGEFVGIIYEPEGDEKIALSTTAGTQENVVRVKAELLKFAPQPETPHAPEVPEAPEMPPTPEGAGGAPPPGGAPGQQGGVDKSKEASGFSPEEADKAKKGEKKSPMEDVLSEESPLSAPGEQVPPEFVSGKVVSLDLKSPSQILVVQDEQGNEIKVTVGPQPQIVNRYLEMSGLAEKYEVEVLYEEQGKDKLAKSILLARPNPAA